MVLWREIERPRRSNNLSMDAVWRELNGMPDYYAVLGVGSDSSALTIKQAYYALTRRYHPDANRSMSPCIAEEKMKALNMAYSVLRSNESRASYDRSRASGN